MQLHRNTMLDEPRMANVGELYQQYAPALFTYLSQHLSAEEDAEDILVEVFLAALGSELFSSLSEKAQLAWLWRVTRNKIVDVYRRSTQRRNVTLESIANDFIDDDDIGPEHFALRQEEYSNLTAHLKSLSSQQQEVLRLRFALDMRCSEIAAHLGKREGAVKVMLSRALNLLKNIYKA
jgi:RNA polymerase sigma factor (sigma-70 family)